LRLYLFLRETRPPQPICSPLFCRAAEEGMTAEIVIAKPFLPATA
jgi:hypothetical protein